MRPLVATMIDVAAAAGVSTATVSRFLRGEPIRSPDAVRTAIAQLGYRPTPAARSLRSGIHDAIAMVVPDIGNPYFASVAKGVEAVFRATPYQLFLCNTDEQAAIEAEMLDGIAPRVDGIILAPAEESDEAPMELRRRGMPVVLVDREINDRSFDSVLVDNAGGAAAAAAHLCELGHTSIAMIGGPRSNTPGRERHDGFLAELARRNITPPDRHVAIADFREAGGYDATLRLMALPDPPSALFCANNAMTIGALKALAALSIAVGETVSVIGFDDVDLGPLLRPPLTVIDRPSAAQGEAAARLLLARLSGERLAPPQRLVLPTRLIVRGSCRPPPPPPASTSAVGARRGRAPVHP